MTRIRLCDCCASSASSSTCVDVIRVREVRKFVVQEKEKTKEVTEAGSGNFVQRRMCRGG